MRRSLNCDQKHANVCSMHRGVPNDENPTVEVLYSRQSHTWRTHALSVALVIQTCWLVLRPT